MLPIMSENPYQSPIACQAASPVETGMQRFGTVGVVLQYVWFAAGMWCGTVLSFGVEALVRPRPAEVPHGHVSVSMAIVLYVPFSFILALLFFGWIKLRSRRSPTSRKIAWCIPLTLGLVYMPLLIAAIRGFLSLSLQNALLGTLISIVLFTYPVFAAEVAFRCGKRGPPGRAAIEAEEPA